MTNIKKTINLLLKNFFFYFNIFFCTLIYGQNDSIGIPEIHNFRRTEYGGNPQNWNIAQNSIGYLYFANNKGLLEFDGVSWTLLTIPNSDAIRSVAIDKEDKIFVGGFKEFGFFDKDSFGKYRYNSISNLIDLQNKESDFIWKIHHLNNVTIFQSFSKIYVYNKGKVFIFKAPNKFQFSFIAKKSLFIQDIGSGILEFKNNKFQKLPNSEIFNNTEVWGISEMDNKHLLLATLDKGLWIFDGSNFTKWKTQVDEIVQRSSCLGISKIDNNKFAFNTVLDGLVIANSSGKILQNISRKNGLQNNTVLTSFVDNKKNIWLGLDNGISFINQDSPFSFFGIDYNLTTVYGSAVFQENLYVATNQGLFYKQLKNLSDEKSFKLVSGTTGQVWSIKSVGNQLLCAHNRGAMLIENFKVKANLQQQGTWRFETITNDKKFVISSNYNGFSLFKKEGSTYKFINIIEGSYGSVNNFEVSNNSIWFVKNNFAHRLQLSQDFSKVIKQNIYKNFNGESAIISNVFMFDNQIYTILNNKFYTFSINSNKFIKSQKYSNLFLEIPNVNNCQQDLQGNIWYASNESVGVQMFVKNGYYKNLNKHFNILKGNLVNNSDIINPIDNSIFSIGTNDGLVCFNIKSLGGNFEKSSVYIKSISFGSNNVYNNKVNFSLNNSIPYKENNLKFSFSAPNYKLLLKTTFSYKLEGFDKKWSAWTKNSFKEYTNLREGKYKMMVRTNNGISDISENSSCSFSILPPWYRSVFAYLIYCILFGAVVYFLRLRIKNKIRQNKYYETIEQRRIYSEKEFKIRQEQLELEKEIERLNNEKLQSQILLKDKELVNNSLQSVKKNKILNGILDGLKEIDAENLEESTKLKFIKINKNISKEVNQDKSWKNLEHHIKNVHHDFLKRLKEQYPKVSPREMDLATYLLLNMSTKEIAEALNISTAGVELARYRLRKKLNLLNKENLTGFLMTI